MHPARASSRSAADSTPLRRRQDIELVDPIRAKRDDPDELALSFPRPRPGRRRRPACDRIARSSSGVCSPASDGKASIERRAVNGAAAAMSASASLRTPNIRGLRHRHHRQMPLERHFALRRRIQLAGVAMAVIDGMGDEARRQAIADARHRLDAGIAQFTPARSPDFSARYSSSFGRRDVTRTTALAATCCVPPP